jgi:sulfatase maturation enzyme AslB (radical SAM superfamily)
VASSGNYSRDKGSLAVIIRVTIMKLFPKMDLKSYLLFSSKSFLKILRLSARIHILPSVIIYPSNICNFKCIMCDDRAGHVKNTQIMDIGTLERIIRECSTYRIKPKIHFSGHGEPLVYPDIVNLMRICKQNKSHWSMTTNGYLLETYAEDLVANGCQAINISIHGAEPGHDQVTGIHNSLKKVTRGLQKLDSLKKNTKNMPVVAVNCVITSQNVLNLKTILDHLIHFPVNSITFQHLIFSADDFRNKEPFTIPEKEKLESLEKFIAYVSRTTFPLKINLFPKIKISDIRGYYSAENDKFSHSCLLPWLSARIYPNGDVGMCNNIYGNIQNSCLKSLINNNKAVMFRRALIKKKFRSPICFRCCHRHYY